MERRKFIKKTALTVSSLTVLSSIVGCDEEEESVAITPISTDKKILIVGAGVAGLGAAKYFKDRGVEVIMIEAQDKIGGRLKTDRSLGVAFDEGASWIHGPNGNPITGLAGPSGANTFSTDDDNVSVYDTDGSPYTDGQLTSAEDEYDSILESLRGEVGKSFEEVFYNRYPQYKDNRLWTYMLSAYLEFDTGGDIGKLSSLDYYDDEAFEGEDLIITNGYDKIAEYLAEGIDIRLNTKVSAIDFSEKRVFVNTDKDTYEADFVLMTVPLGVLKKGIISFTPALSTGIGNAIDNLNMGSVNKYLCVWDTPFWDTTLQYIGYSGEQKGKFNYFMNVKKFANVNALMTFTFGEYSRQAEGMTDDQVITEIMSHLKSIYGNEVPEPISMLRTKWVANEYTHGSYSYVSDNARSSDFKAFEQPMDNKLFFGGEHTSKDYRGTVHGAYLSGIREAEKIAGLL